MRFSQLITKTLRDEPKDEQSISARLLIRAGFIHKNMAGVHSFLPLGLRVLRKIEQIIRQEMDRIGAQEVLLNALQSKELWLKTGRWQSANQVMYQFKDHSGKELGLGWTHEEVVVDIMTHHIQSYHDLPKAIYQIQTKFRHEPRAKSGILRGREFGMKDLYSFHLDGDDLDRYYDIVKDAYLTIFKRVHLDNVWLTEASGGQFSKLSHEFQVVSGSGEDTIYTCDECRFARNAELIDQSGLRCPMGHPLTKQPAIEVGNIFKLGSRFSQAVGLFVTDQSGVRQPVIMASYGIGTGRLMGAIVELFHDDRGIVWPAQLAPYQIHLIDLKTSNHQQATRTKAETIYRKLTEHGFTVLWDDRDQVSPGEMFNDADLIGSPVRLVVGGRVSDGRVELKQRVQEDVIQVIDQNVVDQLIKMGYT